MDDGEEDYYYSSFSIMTNLTDYKKIVVDPLSHIHKLKLTLAEMQENLMAVWRNFTFAGPGMVVSVSTQQRHVGVCLESEGSPVLSHILSELALRITT